MLAAASAQAEPPRLVVQLVVDQLSMAQLYRAGDLLTRDGLGRLLSQGFVARDARYLSGPTRLPAAADAIMSAVVRALK